jgi:hypothetical protein
LGVINLKVWLEYSNGFWYVKYQREGESHTYDAGSGSSMDSAMSAAVYSGAIGGRKLVIPVVVVG